MKAVAGNDSIAKQAEIVGMVVDVAEKEAEEGVEEVETAVEKRVEKQVEKRVELELDMVGNREQALNMDTVQAPLYDPVDRLVGVV